MFNRHPSSRSARKMPPSWRLCLACLVSLILHIAIILPWQWPFFDTETPLRQIYLAAQLQTGKQTKPKQPEKTQRTSRKLQGDKADKTADKTDKADKTSGNLEGRNTSREYASKQSSSNDNAPSPTEETPALIVEQPLPPEYPAEARLRGLEGCVLADVEVSPSGAVSKVTILQADIPNVFDQSVITAQMAAKYYPAQQNGRQVSSHALAVAAFVLTPDKRLNCALKYAELAKQRLQGQTPSP